MEAIFLKKDAFKKNVVLTNKTFENSGFFLHLKNNLFEGSEHFLNKNSFLTFYFYRFLRYNTFEHLKGQLEKNT